MTEAEEKALREQAYDDDYTPDPPTEPEPEKESVVETEEDPLAGVPPALKDQLQQISERLDVINNLDYRLKQTERRVGSVQNEFYAAQKAAKEHKDGPTPEEVEKAAQSEKAWKEMKEEFPDIANAIEAKLSETKPPDINQLREELEQSFGKRDDSQLELRLLGIAHRDWQTVVQTPEYAEWLKTQSPDVQDKALHSTVAEDAIEILDMYKNRPKPKKQNNDRLSRAVDAPRGPAQRPPKSEADLTEAELRQQIAGEVWSEE